MSETFRAGQCWTYAAPPGFETSRLIIGAVLRFDAGDDIVCCAVVDAPQRADDGSIETVTIPFLPMVSAAFAASIVALDGQADVPETFGPAYQAWKDDPKGLTTFTVPFEGFLDQMVARQMASIVGQS